MRALIAALEALRHPKPESFRSLWSRAIPQLCQQAAFLQQTFRQKRGVQKLPV